LCVVPSFKVSVSAAIAAPQKINTTQNEKNFRKIMVSSPGRAGFRAEAWMLLGATEFVGMPQIARPSRGER
jgi:hypothetical protein